jgi:hypothetical protein
VVDVDHTKDKSENRHAEVNLGEKLAQFSDPWKPVVGELTASR